MKLFKYIIVLLALLSCGLQSALAVFERADEKAHYGIFLEINHEIALAKQAVTYEVTWENQAYHYDTASDVLMYVTQNPWTMFDPLGLRETDGFDDKVDAKLEVERAEYKKDSEESYKKYVDSGEQQKDREATTSFVADSVPFVGAAKGIVELGLGMDPITGEKVNRGVAAAGIGLGLVGLKGVGKAVINGLGKTAKGTKEVAEQTAKNLEKKALMKQGLNADEATEQMAKFDTGDADGYNFHFTTEEGAQGIINDGFIKPTNNGLSGAGVYSGTTPTPSNLLKNIGWGLGGQNKNVRIPFKTSQTPKKFTVTPKTNLFENVVELK